MAPHAQEKDSDKTVHRSLNLASPILRGEDVGALQSSVNKQFDHFKIDRQVMVDGELGGQTLGAAEQAALCLGVGGDAQKKLKNHIVSEDTQKLVRGGRDRTKEEQAAGEKREDYRKQLRQRYSKSAGERAIEQSAGLVGVHEEPSGSNWGTKVSEMIKFTGYNEPVFWCGCCAAWIVIHIGGAQVPTPIRFGYAPYITADALSGSNGLTAVSVRNAQPGDIGALWNGEHVVTVREAVKAGDTTVKTREGNTSAADGSQSNGGEVADKERSLSDFDRGIVARPDWS
jgi:hypothetical protein